MLNIAGVGMFGSEIDQFALCDTYELLKLTKEDEAKLDLIDLRFRRDFLRENRQYDIVILNYIFIERTDSFDPDRILAVSPLHNKENWRKRLLETQAVEILVFGYSPFSEVTGEYIGDLPGYKMEVVNRFNGSIWRYRYEASTNPE